MDDKYVETGEKTQESLRAEAQARVSAQAFRSENLAPHEFRRLDCEVCEDDLPLFRMQKGFLRCTVCQEMVERRKVKRG